MQNAQQGGMHLGVRADQRVFERIGLIKAIGLAPPVSDPPTGGFDDGHPSANIPFVTGVMGEHSSVASLGYQTTFLRDGALRLELEAFI